MIREWRIDHRVVQGDSPHLGWQVVYITVAAEGEGPVNHEMQATI
jgi:hypothetical protein